jgi:hypothetical protein
MSRLTLNLPVYVETDSDGSAVGRSIALDILSDEKLTREQKSQELAESILAILLNDSTSDAAEQVYGIVDFLVETSSIKGGRP